MKEGDTFEINYAVTEHVYRGFISIFDDKNPLHTNREFAKGKGFSDVVMHGAILTGFLSHFIGEHLPVKNVIVQSYKISFAKPVYLGTKLLLRAIVAEIFESVNCIVLKYSFENEKSIVSKGEITIGII